MAKIKVRGVVVSNDDKWIYDWFEMEAISPKDVEEQLENASGEDIEVEINSVGGDVYAGSDIYTMLKQYAGNVVVKIVGLAASAASVIAMAGKKVMISPTAQIMIHNVWSMAWGDYRAMDHESDVLKGWNKSIANAYMLKTEMSQSELLSLMNKETWLTAQDALRYKLVDEIMFDDGLKLAASIRSSILPPEVVNKIKNLLKSQQKQQETQPPVPVANLLPPEAPRQAPVDLYQKLNLINRRRNNA
jgi:ATP-dependent Clp protease protease subunit